MAHYRLYFLNPLGHIEQSSKNLRPRTTPARLPRRPPKGRAQGSCGAGAAGSVNGPRPAFIQRCTIERSLGEWPKLF